MSQEQIKAKVLELKLKLKTETNTNEKVHIMNEIIDWQGRLQ